MALFCAACAPIGPAALRTDSVDYADALGEASKRLTLLNIVKLRYADSPTFLSTSQIVAGYQRQANAAATAVLRADGHLNFQDTGGSLVVGGAFGDNPTITFSPVSGPEFGALLLSPIPPADLFGLIQGGVPADLVLGLGVSQVNGIRNSFIAQPGEGAGDPRFGELVDLAVALRAAGLLQLRSEGEGPARRPHLVLADAPGQAGDQARRLGTLLGQDGARRDFALVYGSGPGAAGRIEVLTRSIAEIMKDLASRIPVPAADVAAGRTHASLRSVEGAATRAGIALRTGERPPLPEETFASVRYRGRWFWIDDRDFRSKRVLSFLVALLSLAESGKTKGLPVITIPTG